MNFLEALILGVIQGLTEFLPVSSSGHLELGKALLGSIPEEGMLMTVILHFATSLSTVVVFRKDIASIFKGLLQFKNNEAWRFTVMIVISMIPAAIIGLLFEDQIDAAFSGNLLLVGLMLLLTGGILFKANKAKSSQTDVNYSRSFWVGIAQAIAILPGISRSGATIGTSVMLGIDRQKAARFSFLMVIPLIAGAMLVKTKKYVEHRQLAGTTVNERAHILFDVLSQDLTFENEDLVLIASAIEKKEDQWTVLYNLNEPADSAYNEISRNYYNDLAVAGVSEEKIAVILEHDAGKIRPYRSTPALSLIIGFMAAFITGLFACNWMIAIVKKSKLIYFSLYCFLAGTIAIIVGLI